MRFDSFNTDAIPAELACHNIADRASQMSANVIHIGHGDHHEDGPYVRAIRENIADVRTYLATIEAALSKLVAS